MHNHKQREWQVLCDFVELTRNMHHAHNNHTYCSTHLPCQYDLWLAGRKCFKHLVQASMSHPHFREGAC